MTDVQTTARFSAPFSELIHNVHQFGSHWSWRCGVWYSRADPGYLDGACRYDHTVGSWEELERDATEHLRRWHDVHPTTPVSLPPLLMSVTDLRAVCEAAELTERPDRNPRVWYGDGVTVCAKYPGEGAAEVYTEDGLRRIYSVGVDSHAAVLWRAIRSARELS